MKKNDVIQLEITAFSSDGNGIGRYDNIAVFVPNSAIGDTLKILIVKVLKNFCFGKILEIITPSSSRQEPDCEIFSRCGGCCYRHITYEAETKIKTKRVSDAISRIGKIDVPILDTISAEQTNFYRNKGQYPVGVDENGKLIAGFYSLHSHRIIPCENCLLQPKSFAKIVSACLDFFNTYGVSAYNSQTGQGLVRHIYLREASDGKIMLCIVINGKRIHKSQEFIKTMQEADSNIVSIVLNENTQNNNVILGRKCTVLYGDETLTDTLCGVKIELSPLSFCQVNHFMTEKLYAVAKDFVEPIDKTILDLYCGVGSIGLSMAKEAKRIIGVEIVPEAVENAKRNATNNGIKNADFYCGNANNAAEMLSEKSITPDVVILDPPRKGATAELIDTICNSFSPQRVVYVSCDPATLARDLKIFDEQGYKTQKIQPVDLFPRTSHVETVVLMEKV